MSEIAKDQYFLIIGSMKCGTTSLFEYMENHPEICPSVVKEPEYFSENQDRPHDIKNKVARYEDLWEFDPARHRWAMEGSTGYAKFEEPNSCANIHAAGIRPRMAYIMRDPLKRIVSHYNFKRRHVDWRYKITDDLLVETSNYVTFADQYADTFGAENLLLLEFEDLVRDPLGVTNQALDFLGLSPLDSLPDTGARNVTQRPKSGWERALRRAVPKSLSSLPDPVKAPVRSLLEKTRPEKIGLTPEQEADIRARLAPGMARLHDRWGIDVSKWGF